MGNFGLQSRLFRPVADDRQLRIRHIPQRVWTLLRPRCARLSSTGGVPRIAACAAFCVKSAGAICAGVTPSSICTYTFARNAGLNKFLVSAATGKNHPGVAQPLAHNRVELDRRVRQISAAPSRTRPPRGKPITQTCPERFHHRRRDRDQRHAQRPEKGRRPHAPPRSDDARDRTSRSRCAARATRSASRCHSKLYVRSQAGLFALLEWPVDGSFRE